MPFAPKNSLKYRSDIRYQDEIVDFISNKKQRTRWEHGDVLVKSGLSIAAFLVGLEKLTCSIDVSIMDTDIWKTRNSIILTK